MAASKNDVDSWIKQAKEDNNQYIISVCDTFDYDDYPVYCKDINELNRKLPTYSNANMQRVNEVIKVF